MKNEILEEEETTETKAEDVEVTEEAEAEESDADKIAALEAEVNKWKTDYYKVFADMENLKKRLERDHANQMKFMMQNIMEELLPVIDNFERSLQAETTSEEAGNFKKGTQMIHDQMLAILEKNGLEVIPAEGEPFDPNVHQAVMTEHDDTKEEGIVLQELQRGYKLKGRVIRATLVKVNQ